MAPAAGGRGTGPLIDTRVSKPHVAEVDLVAFGGQTDGARRDVAARGAVDHLAVDLEGHRRAVGDDLVLVPLAGLLDGALGAFEVRELAEGACRHDLETLAGAAESVTVQTPEIAFRVGVELGLEALGPDLCSPVMRMSTPPLPGFLPGGVRHGA